MTTRTRDLIFAALALTLALAIAVTAFGYPVGSSYFPRSLAVFIGMMALLFGLRVLLRPAGMPEAAASINPRALLAVFGGVAAYVFLFRLAGYEIATFAFLLLLTRWLGAAGWMKSLVLAAAITALMNLIFFGLLGVPRLDAILF
ncbi:tripartite tricarboxylate transporter TctB family protein [Sulfitobacter aestuarii]|uniref:Tripartite tricarboxylate transporter TctB family protein n=1 Tax=Sulfitobacter aestuarii TaxID=2161676 RepID=A0ABW5U507_9RHOB